MVGFDGTPILSYSNPPLTTLRQPVVRMAGAVASLLNSPASGQATTVPHLFLPELIAAPPARWLRSDPGPGSLGPISRPTIRGCGPAGTR
ncbi:MAG: hypothetical protein ACRDVM_05835 [Acidimicrobiia bacterium]